MPLAQPNQDTILATRLAASFTAAPQQIANMLRQQSQLANTVGLAKLNTLLGAEFVTAAAAAHAAAKTLVVSMLPEGSPAIADFPAAE